MRVRAIDSTSISGPNSKELTEVHYNPRSGHDGLRWHEVLDGHGARASSGRPSSAATSCSAIATSPVSQVCANVIVGWARRRPNARIRAHGRQGRSRLPVVGGCDRYDSGTLYQRGVRCLARRSGQHRGRASRPTSSPLPRAQDRIRRPMPKGKKQPKTLEAAKYIFIFTRAREMSVRDGSQLYRISLADRAGFNRLKQS